MTKNGRFNEHSKETLLFIVLVDVVVVVIVVVVWLNLKQLLLKAQKLTSISNCKVRKMPFLKW